MSEPDNFQHESLDSTASPMYNVGMDKSVKNTPGPLFVTFSGKKQSGKDTAAQIASNMLTDRGRKVGVIAFADALKDVVINLLGVDRKLVYGSNDDKEAVTSVLWDNLPAEIRFKYSNELCGETGSDLPRDGFMTVREVLQVMGTDIFRDMFEPNVWANSPFRRDWTGYDVVIITDCRFPNEKQITEEHGGIVVRFKRDLGYKDDHRSETALDEFEFDYNCDNNGSLDDLRIYLFDLFSELNLL